MWCLGNEMDGTWQLGHSTPRQYGQLAVTTARAMRQIDEKLELVVCGSSNAQMPQFGEWERIVLEETYDEVDFISCHAYYEEVDGDAQEFLASGVDMARFIESVVATADHVAAVKKSDKRIMISFDEWNVWYLSRWNEQATTYGPDDWPIAPRQLEDEYNVLDAVVFGDLLITLLQHADRVRSASLAQLVNVIAPIMTEPGGPAWRQTTFFPFSITSRLAAERVVQVPVDSGTFTSARFGEVATVNAVAKVDAEGATLFIANRSTTDAATLRLDLSGLAAAWGREPVVAETHLIHDDDPYAANTLDHLERVGVKSIDDARVEASVLSARLPAISWAAVRLT
jgi:alpha-N-arabinofuranosidase